MNKLWLDDVRSAPEGWIFFEVAWDMIDFLEVNEVEEISLDHDLGEAQNGTGYDVLCYIEERVAQDEEYLPPKIGIHTDNPPARYKMNKAVRSIERMVKR